MRNEARKSFFERLKIGLEQAIAHANRELNMKTIVVLEAQQEVEEGPAELGDEIPSGK